MTDGDARICPGDGCGFPIQPGEIFCPNCGREAAAGEPESGPATDKDRNTPVVQASGGEGDAAEPEMVEECGGMETAEPAEEKVFLTTPARSGKKSRCPDFEVYYNVNRVFLEETYSPFELKLIPRAEGITCVSIEVEARGIARQSYTAPEAEFIPGEAYEAGIEFRLARGCHGIIPFTFFLGYRKDDADHWFVAHTKHTVHRQNEPARKILDSLQINVNSSVAIDNRGNAVDVNVSRRESEKLEGITRALAGQPAKTIQDIDIPASYELISLRKCRPRRSLVTDHFRLSASPPPQAITNRLTIGLKGRQFIHLLDLPAVQLGKHRLCDIVTRRMTPEGETAGLVNSRLSRFHCRIVFEGGWGRVLDLAADPRGKTARPSTNGVFLDGHRVEPGRGSDLPRGRNFILSLAGADGSGDSAFGLVGRIFTCRTMGRCRGELHDPCREDEPACLFLKRTDGLPEIFIVLRRFCALAVLDSPIPPEWREVCLFRARGAFGWLLRNANPPRHGWLAEGRNLTELAPPGQVRGYRQFGAWADSGP